MNSYTDFTDRVVVITGGSRGLGHAMALGFAECGARVVVSSRSADSCRATVTEIEARGGRAAAVPCHVGRWQGLEHLIHEAVAAYVRMAVYINNAGSSP